MSGRKTEDSFRLSETDLHRISSWSWFIPPAMVEDEDRRFYDKLRNLLLAIPHDQKVLMLVRGKGVPITRAEAERACIWFDYVPFPVRDPSDEDRAAEIEAWVVGKK